MDLKYLNNSLSQGQLRVVLMCAVPVLRSCCPWLPACGVTQAGAESLWTLCVHICCPCSLFAFYCFNTGPSKISLFQTTWLPLSTTVFCIRKLHASKFCCVSFGFWMEKLIQDFLPSTYYFLRRHIGIWELFVYIIGKQVFCILYIIFLSQHCGTLGLILGSLFVLYCFTDS